MFEKKLRKQFFNIFKFSNRNINHFILLLQKGVYLYKYMDDRGKFSETTLHEKEDFLEPLKHR